MPLVREHPQRGCDLSLHLPEAHWGWGGQRWYHRVHSSRRSQEIGKMAPFCWASKARAQLGTQEGELTPLPQHREARKASGPLQGVPFDFLDCFLGNTGATGPQCLVYKMESIPMPLSCHTGVQLNASIHQGAAEGSSHQMAPRQRNTLTIIVWASHNWAEGEMKEFGVRLSTPVTNGLLQQGFEDKANGKDKEEMRCGFSCSYLRHTTG